MRPYFEHGILQEIFKNISITVIGIYGPSSLSTDPKFISDFFEFTEDIMPQYSNWIFLGDFNLHTNEKSTVTSDFQDSLFALGLEQHVNFSTHTGDIFLDLVITEVTNDVQIKPCEPGPFLSDHCVVKVTTKVEKENRKHDIS